MYKINELVMYRNVGVCKIVDIVERELFDQIGEYYTLKPVNDEKSTIFVKVDNKNAMMRYLLPEDEVRDIVEHLDGIDGYDCDNQRERDEHYKELINSQNVMNWVQAIKGLQSRREMRSQKGKDLSFHEERMLKTAEYLFLSEVAYSMHIPMDNVKDYISEKVGHGI